MKPSTGTCLAASVAVIFCGGCEKSPPPAPASSATSPTAAATRAGKAMDEAMEKATEDEKDGDVQCLGIHECKGKSACHVAGGHACAGQNDCKGKGWVLVPRSECEARGGKINAS